VLIPATSCTRRRPLFEQRGGKFGKDRARVDRSGRRRERNCSPWAWGPAARTQPRPACRQDGVNPWRIQGARQTSRRSGMRGWQPPRRAQRRHRPQGRSAAWNRPRIPPDPAAQGPEYPGHQPKTRSRCRSPIAGPSTTYDWALATPVPRSGTGERRDGPANAAGFPAAPGSTRTRRCGWALTGASSIPGQAAFVGRGDHETDGAGPRFRV
jgi:hypothetical protein